MNTNVSFQAVFFKIIWSIMDAKAKANAKVDAK
jgi:hypothetical protein